MTSGRGGWHAVAFIAALGLMLTTALDWYTTEQGEEFRRVEQLDRNTRQDIEPSTSERAAAAAEKEEKNLWQASGLLDRVILILCLVAVAGAVAAAFVRSIGRRPRPPWNPAAIATVAGFLATLLVLYRILQPPGLNDAAVIKSGAPLGLIAVGFLTVGARLATLSERDEPPEEPPLADDAPPDPGARAG